MSGAVPLDWAYPVRHTGLVPRVTAMRSIVPPAFVFLLLLSSPRAASAGPLRMEFANGYVTISASDVSLRQLLTEWGRLGQTRVVNGEKVGGALLTLELSHVPEKQALEIVLRSVPGYLVAQRTTAIQGGSQYDRIVVMPGTVAPPARKPPRRSRPPPPPQIQQAVAPAMPVEDQDQPVQEAPEQAAAEQEEQPQPAGPQGLPQPGIQPMPPNPQGQGQNDPNVARPPGGPVPVPAAGAVVSPTPGQLPVPPKPQQEQ